MPKFKEIILGIDPGLAKTGYGIIEKKENTLTSIDYGVIKTQKSKKEADRLKEIFNQLSRIIKKHKPDQIAIEKLFFCKNVKTAFQVGQARGIAVLLTAQKKITLREFTPLEVKQAVTSYGQASKKQVQEMVKILLKLKNFPSSPDAADALAIAICAIQTKEFKK